MESQESPPKKISKLEEKKQKEVEREKREQERIEKNKQKEAERIKREEEKRKKDEEKEQERLKREEEKRKKDEEKEQERLKREEEKRKKDEEKEQERIKREEEKQKKDEEKRKKDEEKEQQRLKREEEKLKKEIERKRILDEKEKEKIKLEEIKNKQTEFLNRFLNKSGRKSGELDISTRSSTSNTADISTLTDCIELDISNCESGVVATEISEDVQAIIFKPMPFQVRTGMALAPLIRRVLTPEDRNTVDLIINLSNGEIADYTSPSPTVEPMEIICKGEEDNHGDEINKGLYLSALKKGFGRKANRTEVKREVLNDDCDIQIIDPKSELEESENALIEEEGVVKWRWKLIQFHDNTRPAYWGSWKRKPVKVKGRCPFKQEEDLDYEFDSDDEWEDEPADGEDLNSEKENDEEDDTANPANADDDEEEGWMVPHGYLSDDEGASEDKRDKDTLKSQEEEFYQNMKREKTLGLPIIETENLSEYRIIYPPKKTVRRGTQRISTRPFNQVLNDLKAGTYGGELMESDEEDDDWEEYSSSSNCSSDYDSDEDTDSVASLNLENDNKVSVSLNTEKEITKTVTDVNMTDVSSICNVSPEFNNNSLLDQM